MASELSIYSRSLKDRGRREGRELAAPMARVQKKSTRQNHRSAKTSRPSLREWVTAYT
jgi:hypothetical protein